MYNRKLESWSDGRNKTVIWKEKCDQNKSDRAGVLQQLKDMLHIYEYKPISFPNNPSSHCQTPIHTHDALGLYA